MAKQFASLSQKVLLEYIKLPFNVGDLVKENGHKGRTMKITKIEGIVEGAWLCLSIKGVVVKKDGTPDLRYWGKETYFSHVLYDGNGKDYTKVNVTKVA